MTKILIQVVSMAMALVFCEVAVAKVTLGIRGDFVGTDKFNDPTNYSQSGSFSLASQYTRLDFDGKLATAKIYGKASLDLLQSLPYYLPPASVAAPIQLPSLVKMTELDYTISPTCLTGAGKLDDAGTGGYEALRPFYNHYFFSSSYLRNFPGGSFLDFTGPHSQLRIAFLMQGWDGQVPGVAEGVLGNTLNASAYGQATGSNTQIGYGARYMRDLGKFGVLASYHFSPTWTMDPAQAINTGYSSNTYFALGGKYTTEDWTVTVDYLANTYGQASANELAYKGSATKSTIVAQVDYDMGKWVPQFKFESSYNVNVPLAYWGANNNPNLLSPWNLPVATNTQFSNTNGDVQNRVTQFSIGTEMKDNPLEPYRMHLVYVNRTNVFSGSGYTSANKTINESAIFFGSFLSVDIFK